MDLKEYLKGDFMKAADIFGTEPVLTIVNLGEHKFKGKDGNPDEVKPFAKFAERDQALTLNVTNIKTLGELYGYTSAELIGKRIQLTVVKTAVGDSIQIKAVRPEAPAAAGPSKKTAFIAWCAANPDVTGDARGAGFKSDVEACFPGVDVATLTTEQWGKYITLLNDKPTDDIPF